MKNDKKSKSNDKKVQSKTQTKASILKENNKKSIVDKQKFDVKGNKIKEKNTFEKVTIDNFEQITNNISANLKQVEMKSEILEKLTVIDLEEPKEVSLLKVFPDFKHIKMPSACSTIKPQTRFHSKYNKNISTDNNLYSEETQLISLSKNLSNNINLLKSSQNNKQNDDALKSITKENRKKLIKTMNSNPTVPTKLASRKFIQELADKIVSEDLNPNNHISYVNIEGPIKEDDEEPKPSILKAFDNFYTDKLNNARKNFKDGIYFKENNEEQKVVEAWKNRNMLTSEMKCQVRYINGINSDSNFVYHKNEKWISYLHYDSIIIESVEDKFDMNQIVFKYNKIVEESEDDYKKRIKSANFENSQILNECKDEALNLSNLVLSENNKFLLVYSKTKSSIFSFDISEVKSLSSCQKQIEILSSFNKNSKEYLEIFNMILKQNIKKHLNIEDSNLLAIKLSETLNKNQNKDIKIESQLETDLKIKNLLNSENPDTLIFKSQVKKIKSLNKTVLNFKCIYKIEIPPSNNFLAIILSANNDRETFISVLDYMNSTILTTTVIPCQVTNFKFNPYMTSNEFVTFNSKIFTFWRLSTEGILQYQHGDMEFLHNKFKDSKISSLDFTPPLSLTCTILVVLGLTTGELVCYDSKTNSVVLVLNPNLDLNYQYNINNNTMMNERFFDQIKRTKSIGVDWVYCGLSFFIIICKENLRFFELPNLREIKHDSLNFLLNEERVFTYDSDIIHVEFDLIKGQGMLMTKLGRIYYFDLKEETNIKIYTGMKISNEYKCKIISTKMVNKNIKKSTLREIDFQKGQFEEYDLTDNINEEYYLIIAENLNGNGIVKVWNHPDNSIFSEFEIVNEEIVAMEICPNDLIISISFYSGFLRFFTLNPNSQTSTNKNKLKQLSSQFFLGKFKSVSYQYLTHLKFLPDGKYIFAFDNQGNLFLLKIESYNPLLVQIHHILNISGEISNFNLSYLENYNKFGFIAGGSELQIFNRKYTNILKNLSYDNSIPQFYLYEKINIFEEFNNSIISYCKDKIDLKNINSNSFIIDFCPRYKSIVYILSSGFNAMLIRDIDLHRNIGIVIYKDINLRNFIISSNASFYCLMGKKGEVSFYNFEVLEEKDGFKVIDSNNLKILKLESPIDGYYNNEYKENIVFNICLSQNGKHYVVNTKYSVYTSNLYFN